MSSCFCLFSWQCLYESGLAFCGLTLCAVSCSYATVYKCSFLDGKTGALKLFRNTKEESAAKEIEMMFSLRHPNVIGIYAWFREPGQLLQMGWVFLFCFYLFRCRTSSFDTKLTWSLQHGN